MESVEPQIFGQDPLSRVVAVEPDGESLKAVIFQRNLNHGIDEITRPFVPWLLATEERTFVGAKTRELRGAGYRFRVDFEKSGWRGFLDARQRLRDENIPTMSYGSQTRQFLASTGITLFKEMSFNDIRRMQVDIETTSLSPFDQKARVLLIAISDTNGRQEVLGGDETEIIEELADRIRRWNPDVLEGHNIYSFDLPYLLERAKALGVVFSVGRTSDRSPIVGTNRNFSIGPNSRPFTPVYVYGRHIIDTYLQVQRFDAPRGQISSYGLKECARVYKLAAEDRVEVDRSKIDELLLAQPDLIKKYAAQDVEETSALAALVTPTDFYQTQMVPDVYQNVAVMGNGEKVNSLLVREYLRSDEAIPLPSTSSEYPGGYTEVRKVGVIHRVVKTDVESLYPSLMLTRRIQPKTDTLGVFLPLLAELTKRRLDAKFRAKNTVDDSTEFAYWDGLQSSFKVLINSFYGYIGGPFYFNDYAAARAVTVGGQEIVKSIADELERQGSIVIEIDTDGIYFQPPPGVDSREFEEQYIEGISKVVPSGIRLAHDGRFASMISLKIKNYVLVDYEGRRILKGSSLRSRADELFGREFLKRAFDLLLLEQFDNLSKLYIEMQERIQDGNLTIAELARRERVTTATRDSPQRRAISTLITSGTISVGDIIRVYNKSDGTVRLETEYQNDEDRFYYAQKLHKFAARLFDIVGEEAFERMFPKPKSDLQRLQERLQSAFDF